MSVRLRSSEFRKEREPVWKELEFLLGLIDEGGLRALTPRQLERLPVLYRGALSALSVARSISLDRNLLSYLENLANRAYIAVYGIRGGIEGAVRTFFTHRFPQVVRSFAPHVAVSAFLLLAGTVVGFTLTITDFDRYYSLVPEELAGDRTPTSSTEELRDVLFSTGDGERLIYFASFLFQHNAQIGLLCFGIGFLMGIPVFFLLMTNGMVLGAMAALYHSRGLSLEFWGWILPHGVTELLAVVLCGAAGLALGQALLFPGTRTRLGNLAATGRPAGAVVVGCIALFFVAALIESFFRQGVLHTGVRYIVASITVVVWALYFYFAGRARRAR